MLPEVADRGQRGADAGVVRHHPVLQGDVEVHPNQRTLPVERLRGEVAEGPFGHCFDPMYASRSTQRAEYPISLSYQDETWMKVPSMTFVDSASTVLESMLPM